MKKLLLLLTFFLTTGFLKAQNSTSGVSFSFKAGLNLSTMNFSKASAVSPDPVKGKWTTGFLAGISMDVPLSGPLYLQPEYLYLRAGGEDKNSAAAYTMSYLSLPVLFGYHFSEKLSLVAGPQFDLLISSDEKANSSSSSITHDTEERSISAAAGLEYNLTDLLSLNARYVHGFNHIGIGQRSLVKEFKFQMVQVGVGVRF